MVRSPVLKRKSSEKPQAPSRPLPWFRLYAEMASDPAITYLSIPDQRHFVFLLCLKCSGLLDRKTPTAEYRDGLVAHGLGISQEEAIAVRGRLVDAGLILPNWQPTGWDERQRPSDNSTSRWRKWQDQRLSNVGKPQTNGADVDVEVDVEVDSKRLHRGTEESHRRRGRVNFDSERVTFLPENSPLAQGSLVPLPVVGGYEAHLTEKHRTDLIALFPGVDVPQAFREMRAWIDANPTRRKTRGGILKFVASWLGREQNRARGTGRAPRPGKSADEAYLEQFMRKRGGNRDGVA